MTALADYADGARSGVGAAGLFAARRSRTGGEGADEVRRFAGAERFCTSMPDDTYEQLAKAFDP